MFTQSFYGFLIFLTLMLLAQTAAAQPSSERGQALAGQCVACHGEEGISQNLRYPNLAGQNSQYFVDQLQRYKTGERQNVLMQAMVVGLTDQDMEDLAAYYSSLQPANCSPPVAVRP